MNLNFNIRVQFFQLPPIIMMPMRIALAATILLSPVYAQTFTPAMPPSVPAATGKVIEGPTLRYIDLKIGDGDLAAPAKQYTVHYTGWLRDGTKFDSSVGKEPLQFIQGRRQVIPGFDAGFEGMKVGGKRRIFIPYELAYGEPGKGPIPPKAELIFDVELLAVKDAPAHGPGDDLKLSFDIVRQEAMALAKAVPEDKYGWRPAEGVRSFREVFLHIAYGIQFQLKIADGASKDELKQELTKQKPMESRPLSKDEVLKEMEAAFDAAQTAFTNASAGSLSRDIDFFGTKTTVHGLFGFVNTHIGEHVGQAIAYCRMNGIVPPWSR